MSATKTMRAAAPAAKPVQGDGPVIGILKLETAFTRFIGDIGNPQSLPYPVIVETVEGATAAKVTSLKDDSLVEPFVAAGERAIAKGAEAISTTCGFLVLYQRELARRLPVPVATSSLLQIPQAEAMLPEGRKAGIITFDGDNLGPKHLAAAGARPGTVVVGIAKDSSFRRDILGGAPATSEERKADALAAACELQRREPDLGAVVIECTNVAPYSADIRALLGVPVFDTVTLIEWLATGVSPHRYTGPRGPSKSR